MFDKELEKYKKYSMIKNKSKVNWFNRIRFWKYLREDYINATKDNYIKQDKINSLKKELSATKISLNIACERTEQLEYDLKQKEKETRKVKKQTK